MTLPANIRVNTLLPFPSLVTGTGPVTVSKVNGIWKVGLNFTQLAQQNPAGAQLNNDLLLVYDPVVQTFFTVPMSFFSSASGTAAIKQRSISSSGDLPIVASDQQLNCNLSSPTAITLPGYASRSGLPLIFKDVGMQATANNITLTAAGGETIDGFATMLLDTNGESIQLTPANDGLNTGWLVI